MVNTIDSSLLLTNYQNTTKKKAGDILGKDDFLKILMVQLQNQDPTNPMQDKEFISQMATFSSLEQMTNMNNSLESMIQFQGSQLIGKQVTYLNDQQEEVKAGVTSVSFKNGQTSYQLDNNEVITGKDIQMISE